jgi:hypothetical protein
MRLGVNRGVHMAGQGGGLGDGPKRGGLYTRILLSRRRGASDKYLQMWTFYQVLGDLLHRRSDRAEVWTPWILAFIGSLIAGVMLYAWWTAPAL